MFLSDSQETLERIHAALESARAVLNHFTPGATAAKYKAGHDPVNEPWMTFCAGHRCALTKVGLGQETVDDFIRLDKIVYGCWIRWMARLSSCKHP